MKCIIIALLIECVAHSMVLGSGWVSLNAVSVGAERAGGMRSWLELRGGAGD